MLNLIKRNTPAIADIFILETTERMNGKSYYEISEKDGIFYLRSLRADGKVKLQFLLRDGSVTNIQYLKADAN